MIMSRDRSFKREEPSETSKLFIIVCEGKKREGDYFNYFSELDSRIAVEVIRPEKGDDNSPTGLFQKTILLLEGSETLDSKYDLKEADEVWFVIDTDQWREKIRELREAVLDREQMYIAQSNPCFEVWLYYHFFSASPEFEGYNISKNWKYFLNQKIPGGFDSKKHPILISTAISNAKANFNAENEILEAGSTEVYVLAEKIYKIIETKIDSARNKMGV